MIEFSDFVSNFFFVFGVSFLLSVALIFVRSGRGAADLSAVQASHARQTSRLGGVAVFAGALVGTWFWFSSSSVASSYQLFLLASAPLFIAGLAEDLGYHMGAWMRLAAAVVSGGAFVALFGQWLPRLDMPIIDLAMAIPIIAVPFTVFACVGVTHAFNLIDGLNGLSSLVAISVSVALMAVCAQVSLWAHFQALGLLCAAISGFLLVNFPFGRLFLGDGGAYIVGHILVWTSVSIVWNAPEVSAFAIFLVFFWPIADTCLAMFRRISRGSAMMQPDRLHFHQLIMRTIEIVIFGRSRRHLANPMATLVVIPMAVFPMFLGVLFYDNVAISASLSLLMFAVFTLTYRAGMFWARYSHKQRRKHN